jgi:hypothetical protein
MDHKQTEDDTLFCLPWASPALRFLESTLKNKHNLPAYVSLLEATLYMKVLMGSSCRQHRWDFFPTLLAWFDPAAAGTDLLALPHWIKSSFILVTLRTWMADHAYEGHPDEHCELFFKLSSIAGMVEADAQLPTQADPKCAILAAEFPLWVLLEKAMQDWCYEKSDQTLKHFLFEFAIWVQHGNDTSAWLLTCVCRCVLYLFHVGVCAQTFVSTVERKRDYRHESQHESESTSVSVAVPPFIESILFVRRPAFIHADPNAYANLYELVAFTRYFFMRCMPTGASISRVQDVADQAAGADNDSFERSNTKPPQIEPVEPLEPVTTAQVLDSAEPLPPLEQPAEQPAKQPAAGMADAERSSGDPARPCSSAPSEGTQKLSKAAARRRRRVKQAESNNK